MIIWILTALLGLLFICAAIGLFFVNFALKRQTLDFDFGFEPGSEPFKNSENNRKHKEDWLKTQKPKHWNLKTSDGLKLVASFFPNRNSHKYAIVVHGYTSKKEDMFVYGSFFHDWGFNVLAVDDRAHGKSEGKWIGMGYQDSKDVLCWINKIVKKDPKSKITVFGVSMGGAAVMMLSGLNLPSNVKCLVEDCGYSSVWDEFCGELKNQFHLPTFPVMHIANITAKLVVGYSLKEASSLKHLENAKVPMLFIHGTGDVFVPYAMLDKNIAAYKGPYKEVLRIKDASHGASLAFDPKFYLSSVKNFVDKFI